MSSVAALALMSAACAGDTSRFAMSNPFSNPFSSSNVDSSPTGSIPAKPATAPAPAPRAAVSSAPLPAPTTPGVSATAAQNTVNRAGAGVNAVVTGYNVNGWSKQGGSNVTLGQGETVNALANRYGVPADAIYKVNGLAPGSTVAAGTQLTIPVYRGANAAAASEPARPAPAPKPVPVAAAPAPKPVKPAATRNDEAPSKPAKKPEKVAVVKPEGAKPKPVKVKPVATDSDDDEDETPRAKPKAAEAKPVKPAPKAAETKPAPFKPAPKAADAKPIAPAPKVAEAKPAKPEPKAAEAKPAKPAPAPKAAEAKPAKPEPKVAEAKPAEPPAPANETKIARTEKPEPQTTGSVAANGADFRWPARGRIISGFKNNGNDGINIAVPEGTPVKAADEGTVAYAGSELKGYGNLVLVRHSNGYVSAYAHNGELKVKKGDSVKRGQTIATSGQSGNVSSPQLHFEIRRGATPVDPTTYLN